ncbi:unnamed protein product [Penicillium salamii]|nr:unnamed protein product [Penicillium salamii]
MALNNYSAEDRTAEFFAQTTTTQAKCNTRARELVGGDVIPVSIQGSCSYTVYAGTKQEFVVQFRLRPVLLEMKTVALARQIYGSLVPWTTCHGQMGDIVDGKECVIIYVMDRVQGVSQLEFQLSRDETNSLEFFAWRQNLVSDLAKFFARGWDSPVHVDDEVRKALQERYETDLKLLYHALPDRFRPIVQRSLDSLPAIMSLPPVLLHQDLGVFNVMVDEESHLVGIIDWAEAEVGPFGINLHFLQQTLSELHRKHGWTRLDDYDALHQTFWTGLKEGTGLGESEISKIEMAMTVGLLLSHGFTCRLAGIPPPVPIQDDEKGAYNLLTLDGFLINPGTKFIN